MNRLISTLHSSTNRSFVPESYSYRFGRNSFTSVELSRHRCLHLLCSQGTEGLVIVALLWLAWCLSDVLTLRLVLLLQLRPRAAIHVPIGRGTGHQGLGPGTAGHVRRWVLSRLTTYRIYPKPYHNQRIEDKYCYWLIIYVHNYNV